MNLSWRSPLFIFFCRSFQTVLLLVFSLQSGYCFICFMSGCRILRHWLLRLCSNMGCGAVIEFTCVNSLMAHCLGKGYMLIVSHGAMAIQGLLYIPNYNFKLRHLTVAGIVLLHNEIIDYVFGMMPIYGKLTNYMDEIGYFTFWLSVFTILLVYHLMFGRKRQGTIKST